MMYLKLNADYEQGELVPLLDDAIYGVCQEFCVNRFNKQHRIAA